MIRSNIMGSGSSSWNLPYADRSSAATITLRRTEYRYSTFCRTHRAFSVIPNAVLFILLAQISHLLGNLAMRVWIDPMIGRQDIVPIWLPIGYALVLIRRVGTAAYPAIFIGMCFSGPDYRTLFVPYGSPVIALAFATAVTCQVAAVSAVWSEKDVSSIELIRRFILATVACSWIALAAALWCGVAHPGHFVQDVIAWNIGDVLGGLVWGFWAWPSLSQKIRLPDLDPVTWEEVRRGALFSIRKVCWAKFGSETVEGVLDRIMHAETVWIAFGQPPSRARICAKVVEHLEKRLFDKDWTDHES